jgi:O-antigen ligase
LGGRAIPRRTSSAHPLLLWGLLLGVVARATIFIRQRGPGDFDTVDSAAFAEILMVGGALVLVASSSRLPATLRRIARTSSIVLMAYYAFGAMSAIWSPLPMFSLYKAAQVMIEMLAVFLALSYYTSFQAAEKAVLWVCLLCVLCGMTPCIRLNSGSLLSIMTWHTNSYSASAAILCCYCWAELMSVPGPRRRLLTWIGICAGAAVVLGTSAVSFLAAACGIAVGLMVGKRRGPAIVILLLGAILIAVASGGDLRSVFLPGKSDSDITTFSGRVTLWTDYFEEIKKSPFIGVGFSVLARIANVAYETNAHNSIIGVLGGTGAAGLAIVLAWAFALVRELRTSVRFNGPAAAGCAAAIVAGLVNSLGCDFLGEGWSPSTLVFMCFVAMHALFASRGTGRVPGGPVRHGL